MLQVKSFAQKARPVKAAVMPTAVAEEEPFVSTRPTGILITTFFTPGEAEAVQAETAARAATALAPRRASFWPTPREASNLTTSASTAVREVWEEWVVLAVRVAWEATLMGPRIAITWSSAAE